MKIELIKRTLTGIAFVAILVLGIVLGPQYYAVLFAVITGLTTWEFCTLINNNRQCQINRVITTVASVYLFAAVGAFNANITGSEIFIPYLLTISYLLISELYFKDNNTLMNWAFTMMAQLYIALPFASLNALAFFGNPFAEKSVTYYPTIVLSIFIFLWSNDTGAYCFGSMLGRHKLFPRISPKKSWEGVIGGLITALAASQVVAVYSVVYPGDRLRDHLTFAGLALVVVAFGTWGDLVESLLKRRLGVKDSGNMLPGHGGMLDRFDSALLAIPAAVVYMCVLMMN